MTEKQIERRLQRVLKLREGGYSYSEIGKKLGVSRQRVHQILKDSEDILAAREKRSKRRERVLVMRDRGHSFAAIARKLGICEDYAKQIYRDERGSTVI